MKAKYPPVSQKKNFLDFIWFVARDYYTQQKKMIKVLFTSSLENTHDFELQYRDSEKNKRG